MATTHEARGACGEDRRHLTCCARDTHHDCRDRHDAVVGAEHTRPKPVEFVGNASAMGLVLVTGGGVGRE